MTGSGWGATTIEGWRDKEVVVGGGRQAKGGEGGSVAGFGGRSVIGSDVTRGEEAEREVTPKAGKIWGRTRGWRGRR
jgi:hypothetical protein